MHLSEDGCLPVLYCQMVVSQVTGVKCRGRKTWEECVRKDTELFDGQYSGMCGGTSYRQQSKSSLAWKKWTFSK